MSDLRARFLRQVDQSAPGGCWLWTGEQTTTGYGRFQVAARPRARVRAHRWAYEHLGPGPIPAGLVIDHLCRVALCVNPSHLQAVTQRENTLRGQSPAAANAAKAHCKRGHPFAIYGRITPVGYRRCRACDRAWKAAARARAREGTG